MSKVALSSWMKDIVIGVVVVGVFQLIANVTKTAWRKLRKPQSPIIEA